MKLKGLLLLIGLFAAVAVWPFAAQAQDTDDQAAKAKTVTGCLAKVDEPNEFYLTADDGKRYEVRSDRVALADHVGHKVTVKGTAAKESDEVEEREEEWHKEAAEGNVGNLQVSDLQMVSTSCK